MTDKQKKAFDNVVSRGELDAAKAAVGDLRSRVDQVENDSFTSLEGRVKELSAAVMHLQESLATLKSARGLRGR